MGLVLSPTTGSIFIGDADVTDRSENERAKIRLRDFGFVFQQAALIPALTIVENIVVSRAIQGAPHQKRLRQEAVGLLEDLGLAEYADAKPPQLSTGQQQRVGIARALIGNPLLLLCDEPTSALDVESSRIVLETLKGVSGGSSRGVVLISHDPRVFPYADRLIKLEDGTITYDTRTGIESEGISYETS
jgi:putative ABC transport system ATP-binding protein